MSARAELVTAPPRRGAARDPSANGQAATSVSSLGGWHWPPPTAWRIGDAILALATLAAVVVAGNADNMPQGVEEFLAIRVTVKNVLLLAAFGWVWPGVLTLCGLYVPGRLRTGEGEWPRMAFAGVFGGALAMAFPLTSTSGLVTTWHVVAFGVVIVLAELLLRTSVRSAVRHRSRSEARQILLVGSGPLANRLYQQLLSDPVDKVSVVGFVDSHPCSAMSDTGSLHLGELSELEQILMRRVVDDVFIGLPVKSHYDEIRESLAVCARVGVRASYSGDLFGGHPDRRRVEPTAPVLSMSHPARAELLLIKRVMDVAGAAALLVLLGPAMIVIALLIKLTSTGPVLFAQDRYGYMKRKFRMYKFRTMVADAERMQAGLEERNEATGPVFKIRNDPRITRVGRFLRKSSLDELPQLWHVLVGEMSLVGPRPMATRDVGRFAEPWLMRRFSVRPGLTCLWQVGGRSNLPFERWIELDLEYIDRWSLWLDVRILLQTIPAVFRGKGAE